MKFEWDENKNTIIKAKHTERELYYDQNINY